MMVILRENVENLGRVGDVVKVSDGFARNFLLPQHLGVEADQKNIAAVEHQKRLLEKKRLAQRASAAELAKKLEEVSCVLTRKVGEHDKLFGSVSAKDIVDALSSMGYSVEKRMVQIPTPIKTLGAHAISIRLEPEIVASLNVTVSKEA